MRRFLIGVLACIGGLALLVAVVVAILVSRYISHETELPGRILLTADWRERLSESAAALDLGQVVRLVTPRLGYGAGRDFIVVGIAMDGRRQRLTAPRPNPPENCHGLIFRDTAQR